MKEIMKKNLAVLMMVLLLAMLFVSCDNSTSEPETKTCTVTFDLNGGTGDIKAQTVKEGNKAQKPEKNPENLKGAFEFWSLDGSAEYKFDTAITADTTIKAVWKTSFEIGDTGPAGGTIFYVNPDYEEGSTDATRNWKYLEAAKTDLTGAYAWGKDGSFGTETGIGKGKSNTKILAEKGADYKAACEVWENNIDGYSDWFLPSKEELDLMYTSLKSKDKGFDWQASLYWSSSEDDSSHAWGQFFNNGGQYSYTRITDACVRPVRAF